jgi:hypothetical protein
VQACGVGGTETHGELGSFGSCLTIGGIQLSGVIVGVIILICNFMHFEFGS